MNKLKPPSRGPLVAVFVRVPKATREEIKAAAAQAGVSVNTWCCRLLVPAAQNNGQPKEPQTLLEIL